MGASQSTDPRMPEEETSTTGAVAGALVGLVAYPLYLGVSGAVALAKVPYRIAYPMKYKYTISESLDPEFAGRPCFITEPLDDLGDYLTWWYALLNIFKTPPFWVDKTEFSKTDFLIRYKPPHPLAGLSVLYQYDKEKSRIKEKTWDYDGDEFHSGMWILHKDPVRIEVTRMVRGRRRGGNAAIQHLQEGLMAVQKSMGRPVNASDISIDGFAVSPSYPHRPYSSHPAAVTESIVDYVGNDFDRLWYEWILFEVTSGKIANQAYEKQGVTVRPDMDSLSGSGVKCCLSDPLDNYIDYERFTAEMLGAIRNPSQHLAKLKSLEVEDISDKEFVVNTEWEVATSKTPTTKTQQRAFFDRESRDMRIELSNPKSTMCYKFHLNPFRVEAWGEVGGQRKSGQIATKVVQETLDMIIGKVLKEKNTGPLNFSDSNPQEVCKKIAAEPYKEFTVMKSQVSGPGEEEQEKQATFSDVLFGGEESPKDLGADGAKLNFRVDKFRSEISYEVHYNGETNPHHKMYAKLLREQNIIECWKQDTDVPMPMEVLEPSCVEVLNYLVEKIERRKGDMIEHSN